MGWTFYAHTSNLTSVAKAPSAATSRSGLVRSFYARPRNGQLGSCLIIWYAPSIKPVMKGSAIFCVGFVSAGGRLPKESLPAGTAVGIFVEGKQHALAVGILMKSTDDIKADPKGGGCVNSHYLGDGLWECKTLKN